MPANPAPQPHPAAQRGSAPEDRGPEGGPLRIGYILKMFPRLSETFILNEPLAHEEQGADVSVFSLMHPADGRFHGRLSQLRLTSEYVLKGSPETQWNTLRAFPEEFRPSLQSMDECADFCERHAIAKPFDLMLRAAVIAATARQRGIRHFHAHFATIATHVAAMASHMSGIPFSFTSHAKDIFRETVRRDLYREVVDRSAFNITVSDFNRRYILEQTPGIDESKVIRLYNGIDLSFFDRPEAGARTADRPHIVSVGRLVPKKGFDHLLRALALCKERGLDFRTTIVGDGDEEENLLALRGELGLDAEVDFAGALPQEEVRRLCADATLMALACVPDADGNMDALPTVLLEALALDLPIACTTLTGQPEIVGDEAGVMAEPEDAEGMARAITEVWERIRGGRIVPGVARDRAERLFDLRKNAGTLLGYMAKSAAGASVP